MLKKKKGATHCVCPRKNSDQDLCPEWTSSGLPGFKNILSEK